MECELILAEVVVVDGTGTRGYTADVGLRHGQVAAIGALAAVGAAERLDVTGCVVCPGFIDLHSHSDLSLLVCPDGDSKIRQGVTTEVIGNCGFSPAPLTEASLDAVRRLHGSFGSFVSELAWDWRTYGDYAARVAASGLSLNVVPLAGHTTIRAAVMGFDQRAPTGPELDRLRELVRGAMRDGSFGLTSGLVYPPGSYADTDELVELARVVAEFGGFYASHVRGEGHALFRAVAEAIEIGERAGVRVEISHHKAAFRPYWGRVRQAIRLSEWARERGQEVAFDVYPYAAGSAPLTRMIPEWAHEGGPQRLLDRLRNPRLRSQIRREGGEVAERDREWSGTLLAWMPTGPGKEDEGRTLAEAAERRGLDPMETVLVLLEESEARAIMVDFVMSEEDVRYVMRHPLAAFGSDGLVLSPRGPLAEGRPHPRSYGAYPRILGHYVRDEHVLSLEEAVHKATYRPAETLRLHRKGRVQVGADADLVVLDPRSVKEEATYTDPHRFPSGIDHVLVAGELTVRDGRHTGVRAGRVLRPE